MNFVYKKITLLLKLIPGVSIFAGEIYLSAIVQANESIKMTGMYSYWADVGLFTACEQTKRVPVAQCKLTRAYDKLISQN